MKSITFNTCSCDMSRPERSSCLICLTALKLCTLLTLLYREWTCSATITTAFICKNHMLSQPMSTIKATARIKHQSTPVTKSGQVIYSSVDILPPVSAESLPPKSHFPALLILVDAFSRFTIIGMPRKSSQSVIVALSNFAAEHRLIWGFTFWDIEKIKSDASTKFTSQKFEQFFADKRVTVTFAPPKHQEGNNFAEMTWQSLRKLTQCMLMHARLPDMYLFIMLCFIHAMCSIFYLLRIW